MFFLIFSIKAAIGSGLLIETAEFLSSMSSINKNYLPENQRLHIFTNLLVDNVGNRTVNFKVHDYTMAVNFVLQSLFHCCYAA